MSRRDYQAIAERVNKTLTRFCGSDNTEHNQHERELISASFEVVVGEIAEYLSEDNPAFDAEKFMQACGFRTEIL